MDTKAKVSIIIPIYNVKDYLDRCLTSVINQTYDNLEIILVDDGSTDGSSKICDMYALRDQRIIVIHKENGGLVSARKAGIEIAQGQFIGFVDGDDYVSELMYERLMNHQMQSDADCVHSGYIVNNSFKIPEPISLKKKNYDSVEILLKYIFSDIEAYRISSSIWSKLFKRDVIKKIYNKISDADSYGEDLLCLIHCICEKISFVSTEEAFYFYTIRENSLSNLSLDVNRFQKEINLYISIQNLLKNHNIIDELQPKLNIYFQRQMAYCLRSVYKDKIYVQRYTLDNKEKFANAKIAIYGAGEVGQDYYSELCRIKSSNVVAWVDKNYEGIHYSFRKVEAPYILKDIEFDYLLIALSNKKAISEVKEQLINQGIDREKIIDSLPLFT